MRLTLILLFIVVSNYNAFSQEKTIITKFNQDGVLYERLDEPSKSIANFKEDEKCIVISYLGDYVYKIKYKEWEGFVKDQFLIINEDMMDLFFANEEKQRLKAIATKEKRQKKIRDIVTAEDEKQKKIDSIAKVKEEQKKKELEALEIAKEYQKLLNQQRKQDSITKAKEKKRLQNIALENARIKQEQLNQKRIEDSITNAKEEQKKRELKALEVAREYQNLLNQQRKQDSITKVKEKKRLQNVALENARIKEEQEDQRRREDSIAKAKKLQKIREQNIEYERLQKVKALQKTKDSIKRIKEAETKQMLALKAAKIKAEKLAEQKKLDSIAKVINLQKIRDSINKVKEEEERQIALLQYQKIKQDQLLAEQKKQDSIAKIKEKDPEILEEIKFKNTCHYLINEYDQYYGRQLIITDKYLVAKNLNIELIREGDNVKIHLNTKENLGCASYVPNTRSSARITLENNQIITLYHSGSLDCNDFSLKAELSEPKIDLLKYSPIKSISFRGTKGSITILDIDYKTFFIDKLKCIE